MQLTTQRDYFLPFRGLFYNSDEDGTSLRSLTLWEVMNPPSPFPVPIKMHDGIFGCLICLNQKKIKK